jgi:tetratricopeptide (TPR) repeat protein/predicted nucleic acid-binding protein
MRISEIRTPDIFQRLCHDLFAHEHDDFQYVDDSAGDRGNDGYTPSKEILFAIYCPEKPASLKAYLDKIRNDLGKAKSLAGEYKISKWVFVTPAPLPEKALAFLLHESNAAGFSGLSMSEIQLQQLLAKYPEVKKRFPDFVVADVQEEIKELRQKDLGEIKLGIQDIAQEIKGKDEMEQKLKDAIYKQYDDLIVEAKKELEAGKFQRAKENYLSIISKLKTEKRLSDPFLLFRAHTNLAVCEQNLGNLNDAARLFREAHSYAPEHVLGIANLALAQLYQGETELALKTVETIDQNDIHCIEVKGNILVQLGRIDEAIEFTAQKGNVSLSKYFTFLKFRNNGDYANAIKTIKELLQEHPDDVHYLENHAECVLNWAKPLLGSKNRLMWDLPPEIKVSFEEAEVSLTKALEILESRGDRSDLILAAFVNRSAARVVLGNAKDALKDCEKALLINDREENAWLNKGRSEIILDDYQNAEISFEKYYALGGRMPEAIRSLAVCYLELGETQKAKEFFKKELPDDISKDLFLAELALDVYDRSQDSNEADALADRLEQLGDNSHALRILAKHFYNTGKQGAEELIQRSIAAGDEDEKKLSSLFYANFLFRSGDHAEALEYFQQVIDRKINNDATQKYIYCLYYVGKYAEALELIKDLKAEKVDPNLSQVEAAILLMLGNVNEARDLYLALYQKTPNRTDYLVEYGVCLIRSGEPEKAVKSFDQIRKSVKDAPNMMTLAEGYKLAGQFDKAIEIAFDALQKEPNDSKINLAYVSIFLTTEQGAGEGFKFEERYIKAFQDIFNHFNENFPKETALVKIEVDEKFTKLFENLDAHAERINVISDLYKKGLPLSSIPELSGRDIFNIWAAFSAMNNMGIRVAVNSVQEKKEEFATVRDAKNVVIDILALFTLASLDKLNILKSLFGSIIVHQSTLDELLEIRDREGSSKKGYMSVGKINGQYIREEVTPQDIERKIHFLDKIIAFIKNECERKGNKKELDESDLGLVKILGKTQAVSTILAVAENIPLLSDDATLRALLRHERQLKSFSTDKVLALAADKTILSEMELYEALIKLLRMNYFYLSLSSWILGIAARKDGYETKDSDFSLLLRALARPETEIASLISNMANFLQDTWTSQLSGFKKMSVLELTLGEITKNHPASKVIPVLIEVLRKKMSLSPFYFEDISKGIIQWTKSSNPLIHL